MTDSNGLSPEIEKRVRKIAKDPGYVEVSILRVLLSELDRREARMKELENKLRAAPMPVRESTIRYDNWDEAYDKWWYENASEVGIASPRPGGTRDERGGGLP